MRNRPLSVRPIRSFMARVSFRRMPRRTGRPGFPGSCSGSLQASCQRRTEHPGGDVEEGSDQVLHRGVTVMDGSHGPRTTPRSGGPRPWSAWYAPPPSTSEVRLIGTTLDEKYRIDRLL